MNILFLNTTKGIQTNAHFNHHHCSYYKKIVHNNMNNIILILNIYKVLVFESAFNSFNEIENDFIGACIDIVLLGQHDNLAVKAVNFSFNFIFDVLMG